MAITQLKYVFQIVKDSLLNNCIRNVIYNQFQAVVSMFNQGDNLKDKHADRVNLPLPNT